MKKAILGIAAAAATLAMAPAANAAITVTPTDTGMGSFSIGFNAFELASTFSETINFTVASGLNGLFSLGAITTASTSENDVDFSNVLLTGGTLGSAGVSIPQILGEPLESRGISGLPIGAGTYTVTFTGTRVGSNGTFGGNLSFNSVTAAVPETATWGMMILGMGMVGASLRRRSAKTTVKFA